MTRRLMILALMLILLFGLAPLLSGLIASAIAHALDCGLDEGSVHVCMLAGYDIGAMLYTMFVMIWFAIMTIPLAGIAFFVWLVVALILFVRHKRRLAS